MKPGWFAVFALPVLCTSLGYPQVTSPTDLPSTQTHSDAKTATRPNNADVTGADQSRSDTAAGSRIALEPGSPALTEDELRQRLVGRQLFLRGLWLDDDLHFNLHGELLGQSPKGSFTLCSVEIDHVRLTKNRVEMDGVRYGIHFEDEADWSSQAGSFDRIRITPKKKHLHIVLDRQVVVIPKNKKVGKRQAQLAKPVPVPAPATPQADQATTTSPAESAQHVRAALDKIFAPALDEKMIAQMPDYWQFFYRAQLDHKSIEPTDPSVFRPGPGIEGPSLVKNVAPSSNDYAQRAEVAGVASYKVILGTDGKPLAVAVYRPIGFGLDENAVAAIRKSSFQPAIRNGKPVESVIDLAVNFRIYSRRTAEAAPEQPDTADAAVSPVTGKAALPGLYSSNASQP